MLFAQNTLFGLFDLGTFRSSVNSAQQGAEMMAVDVVQGEEHLICLGNMGLSSLLLKGRFKEKYTAF